MFLFRLALRNVTRQYGRTALSMVSIVAGVAVIIVGRAFISGSKENIIRAEIDSMTGHVLAVPADYPDTGVNHPVEHLLELTPPMRAWLDGHSVAWTTRTFFTPRVVRGPDAMRVRAIAYDPKTDTAVFPRKEWRVDGAVPEKPADGVLLSRGVARVLGVHVGESLIFEARTAHGALNALEWKVSGIVATGNPMFDRIGVFLTGALAKELIVTDGGFSHLAMKLKDRDDSTRIAPELAKVLGPQARVTTWQKESAPLVDLQDIRQAALDLIALALMAIAAAGIANTVLMAAHERVREIGTLRAMGLARRGVVGLFVLEGLAMGIVGSLLGGLLGGAYAHHLAVVGIDLTAMIEAAGSTGAYQNVPFSTMLYAEFSPPTIMASMVVGLVVAVFSSIYPALIASRMPPAEAVRSA